MSSQTRIDYFFKSTSGKQQPVKKLSRSKSDHKLLKKDFGNSFARQPSEKNSLQEKSANNVVHLETIHKSSANTSVIRDQSDIEDNSISVVNVTTPSKKTIRGFVLACNSPPVNSSPGKISLKRQNSDSPGMSGAPKKSPVFHKNVADLSKTHSTHNTDFSRLPASRNSSNLSESFDKTSDLDIVKETDKKSPKLHLLQSNVERPVGISNKEVQNFDDLIKTEENEPNLQRDNMACDKRCNSEKNDMNITPKKRKMRDISSLKKSPSSSGWKHVISIETADFSMTALSSNWQMTLEASQELEKSSAIDEQRAKENVPAMHENEGNNDNLSEKSPSARDGCSNDYAKKKSPRRALFSPGNSANKVHFEGIDCAPSTISAKNSVVSLRNGEITSFQGISKSSNLRTNVNIDCTARINENSNLTEEMAGPSKTANSTTKVNATTNSPTKIIGTSSMPRNMTNSATTPTKVNKTAISPTKKNELLTTLTKSPSRNSKSTFSPRFKVSPVKPYKERVDTCLATRAVENLNQAKQGIIPMNDFDLELIYTKKSFEFEYGRLKANTAIKYEAKDVQVPEEKHADHFFMVLVNVFSEALNCGYFDEDELDTVFSIFTLSGDAQSLLARMLKRKRGWHRVSNIKYAEISNDLEPIFKELVDNRFLDSDIANEDISKSLNVLQVDEIKAICQAMKRPKATKPAMISDLVKLANKKASLFPGMKSPSCVLHEKINATLGLCIRLPDRIENLLNRIFILLIPNQDPQENMVEAFRMLIQVHFGEKRFPETPKERFPIFRNRLHLIRYAEARSAYNQIINASEAKDWDTVRMLGQIAYDNLKPYFESSDSGDDIRSSMLPSHVKRYDPNYVWVKVMSKSVEGFKKTKESMWIAAQFLHTLVSSSNKIPANRTRWYSELAMIESYHRKNFELSAEVTLRALTQENISEIDVAEILERARKLCKSKAVSTATKERINYAVSLRQEMFISTSEPTIKEIEATMVPGNTSGSKSTWSMNIGGADTGYVKVEDVALRYYLDEGFRSGVHCEGALPVTLFATLLWEEIYTVPVPGAFVSSYQDAPLDLYTSHFLEPRRELIENKLKFIRRLDLDSLSSVMHEDFVKYRKYESLMHGNLFADTDDFKDFIECLGIDAVVGICERLAGNYNQWKSGFPDLALWNPVTKKCKIVEVKGPGDSLSTKQKLWIQFLETLGVEVEVCIVKGTTKRYAI